MLTKAGTVRLVKVPWAMPGSSFTLLFEHDIQDLVRGAYRTQVRTVTMDMSKAYIAGASEAMPQADIVFDRFQMNEAVDAIRRAVGASLVRLVTAQLSAAVAVLSWADE